MPDSEQSLRGGRLPVIGIGTSAGGLEALQAFMQGLAEEELDAAIVLVQHQDPTHESLMAELLSHHTTWAIQEAVDGEELRAGHVYLKPPAKFIALEDGRVRLLEPTARRGMQRPIDHFFHSLAAAQGPPSVAVILSGAGTDGTLGARAVKEANGYVLVQDPREAGNDGMPRSAIEMGIVDRILEVGEMPRAIGSFLAHPYARKARDQSEETELTTEEETGIEKILRTLRRAHNHDFSLYKQGTLVRRIARRMGLLQIPDLEEYARHLSKSSEEVEALFQDLLLGVTSFFRAPESFEVLARQVLSKLCTREAGEDPIRIWVPGCSSGEEAYSLAILLYEKLDSLGHPAGGIQIFATDASPLALDRARAGEYPASIASDISPERLAQFFDKKGDIYCIAPFLRDTITFAQQDLLQDAPFSNLDLISCRNLLIYLKPEAQRRVLEIFHFGLNTPGYLFLGNAEGLSDPSLFEPIDQKHSIYRRKGSRRRAYTAFRSIREGKGGKGKAAKGRKPPKASKLRTIAMESLLRMLEPAAVLLDQDHDILQFFGDTTPFLRHPEGSPTNNLHRLAPPALSAQIRTLLHRLEREAEDQVVSQIVLDKDEDQIHLRLEARVVEREDDHQEDLDREPIFLLLFTEEKLERPHRDSSKLSADEEAGLLIRELESELQETREELQGIIEQLETSNEELKASNEEILSMNEELETSQEELQSLNEELSTVNAQLRRKIEEIEEVRNDLENFLANTEIATLFLDRELRLRRFTPEAEQVFEISEADTGRAISNLTTLYENGDIAEEARQVLENLQSRSQEVRNANDRWFLRRLHPYRTESGGVAGVVVTFYEITERKRRDRTLARMATIVESTREAILSMNADGIIESWNPAAEAIFGWSAGEAIGRHISFIVPEDRLDEVERDHELLRAGRKVPAFETKRTPKDGGLLDIRLSLTPILDDQDELSSIAAVAQDITSWKRTEHRLQQSEERFRIALDSSPIMAFEQDGSLRYTWVHNPFDELTEEDLLGKKDSEIFPVGSETEAFERLKRSVLESRSPLRKEIRLTIHGVRRHLQVNLAPRFDGNDTCNGVIGAAIDITSRKKHEDALAEADRQKDTFIALLAHELRNPLAALRAGLEVLRHDDGVSDPRILEDLEAEMNGISRLLSDLLDISRISHGKIHLQQEVFSASRLLDRVRHALEGLTEAKNLSLTMDLPDGTLALEGDPQRLEQILCNLVQNAITHTPDGGRIRVEMKSEGDDVLFLVHDTGKGLEPDDLDRIFEAFHQEEDDNTQGLGLGLSLSREIARLHGGTLVATSPGSGQGSTFRLLLPDARRDPDEMSPEQPPTEAKSDEGRRVLLVDDERSSARLMSLVLRDFGHEVVVAHSGEDALETQESFQPDIVLLDIKMAGIGGLETARRLRSRPAGEKLRILAFTGFNDAQTLAEIEEAGFDGHILKGAPIEKIRDELRESLRSQETGSS